MEGYLEHSGTDTLNVMTPYCKSCYNKSYAPKGVNAGLAATTDLGASPATKTTQASAPAASTEAALPVAPAPASASAAATASKAGEEVSPKANRRGSALASRMGSLGLDLSKVGPMGGMKMPGMGGPQSSPPAAVARMLAVPGSLSPVDSIGSPTTPGGNALGGMASPLASSSTTSAQMSRASLGAEASKKRRPTSGRSFSSDQPLAQAIEHKAARAEAAFPMVDEGGESPAVAGMAEEVEQNVKESI